MNGSPCTGMSSHLFCVCGVQTQRPAWSPAPCAMQLVGCGVMVHGLRQDPYEQLQHREDVKAIRLTPHLVHGFSSGIRLSRLLPPSRVACQTCSGGGQFFLFLRNYSAQCRSEKAWQLACQRTPFRGWPGVTDARLWLAGLTVADSSHLSVKRSGGFSFGFAFALLDGRERQSEM